MSQEFRHESDLLGTRSLPADTLWGIHTLRAMENFDLAHRPVHPSLSSAMGTVKLACFRTNRTLGVWNSDPHKADAIEQACCELHDSRLSCHIVVDSLQGGAGTSLNMNVNEVIANRALQILGLAPGTYGRIDPLADINCHQSTNDTVPTAVRMAAIRSLSSLEEALVELQESCQNNEKRFAHIVKVGRTQLQDAVLTTLGRSFGAFAEAFNRDRWRVSRCVERLRVVNLGGTAIGSGAGAPRQYIFRVVDELRSLSGIGFARAENLIDATQNCDVFVEVSGILKACASSLLKISNDVRLLASGPQAGLGEITLPARQTGSTIMPGKINPVIPEAVGQAALLIFGHDATIAMACGSGNLELNQYLPLIAHCLLESIDLLTSASRMLCIHCIAGITCNESNCARHVESTTAAATALIPLVGYHEAQNIVQYAQTHGCTIREAALAHGTISASQYDEAVSPEAVCRLGTPPQGGAANSGTDIVRDHAYRT